MACKDCVHVREPMRGFYNQVYCDYLHIHVSDQPYYDASKRCSGYKTKQTNADRIRSMTDKELANRIVCHVSCSCCPLEQEDCKKHCYELWFEWLRKEAE